MQTQHQVNMQSNDYEGGQCLEVTITRQEEYQRLASLAEQAEEQKKTQELEVFYLDMPKKGVCARAVVEDNMMKVLAGSIVAEEAVPSMSEKDRRLRDELISDGVIADEGEGNLMFTCDHYFNSPSEAACVVAGGSRNGLDAWKDKVGRSMKELRFRHGLFREFK